ncbi:Fic family protein [Parasphaerochaeta coccoides]|uniref:Filamentation induced by cAMP protein Fic n=1 Tax=Parasphaerochaeta coccoides (strain ATCC BAA-1237 / DSM 17374 / SPN1) TaxID=760011 RepID=F4GJZ5_PARC1|nr:Fic family protein [Parasphaerochaeta coccoides]AEC01420.1 filamentation induced by cAMP protein Fic [Parasphaerochaeta coccoides DSM 17374]
MRDKPTYTITEKAADSVAKIVETVGRLTGEREFVRDIRLHRENRIRTIHSSLAIEGNSLSLKDVTAVLDGKIVAGKQTDIKEVKNAYQAYDEIMSCDPYDITDFLKAHKLMTDGLIRESGVFRSEDVGVFDGDVPIHSGARPQFVPRLVEDLFVWGRGSDLHPVLKSAIIHYEIETIHPFADGNGRMGRLWQTLILAKWNSLFAWIPMESVMYKKRPLYYEAIEASRDVNDSGAFIEFTLSALLEIITTQVTHTNRDEAEHQVKHQVKHQVELTEIHVSVLRALEKKPLSRKEIFSFLAMSGDTRAYQRHLAPLLDSGLIERTIPDKPNSRMQKYRLTDKGKS